MVFSWGDGKKGQLGHGSKELTIQPSPRHSKTYIIFYLNWVNNITLSLYTYTHTHISCNNVEYMI